MICFRQTFVFLFVCVTEKKMEAAKQEDNDDNEVQKDRALTQVYSKAGWPLRLERHPDVGRYLVATRDIEPGFSHSIFFLFVLICNA